MNGQDRRENNKQFVSKYSTIYWNIGKLEHNINTK